jgi:hypothetical protein
MVVDLTHRYKVNEKTGVVKYTVKAHGVYYTGVAKTNFAEGDVFDLEKGKRIAKLRAILKMKRGLLKEALEIQACLNELVAKQDEIQELIQKLTQSASNVQEKLNKVLDIPMSEEDVNP